MNPIIRLQGNQLRIHFFWWILVFGYFNTFSPIPGSWAAKILGGTIDDANYIFVFYTLALYTFPKYWEKRNYSMIIINIFIGYCLFSLTNYLLYIKLLPILGGHVFYQNYPISTLLKENILYYSIFGSAGVSWFLNRYSAYNHKLQAEKEKLLLKKELNYVKNQFNSHITINFLNYCLSKIHREQPKIAESIDIFSEMLRYNLKTKPDIKVSLHEEIKQIENYINLCKSINYNLSISFDHKDNSNSISIVPHILISFIEDSFNQGINNSKYSIELSLLIENASLFFMVKTIGNFENNQIIQHDQNNTKQFLDFYYPSNYYIKKQILDKSTYFELVINTMN
jgi:sensor histidine kinase YesM